jgi:hypothetical protein
MDNNSQTALATAGQADAWTWAKRKHASVTGKAVAPASWCWTETRTSWKSTRGVWSRSGAALREWFFRRTGRSAERCARSEVKSSMPTMTHRSFLHLRRIPCHAQIV